jgi:glycosyltransferase involved in cell wall biosynthesis
MRIVIDMQGAQGASRTRGIGRYSLAIAKALVRNRRDHEILLALNGMMADSIEQIRNEFDPLLPQENIRVWHANGPVHALAPANQTRRHQAELLREAFLADLHPDFLYITSIFEGYSDEAVHSINQRHNKFPTAVSFYDLIPLLNKETYLESNRVYNDFYNQQLAHMKGAQLFLAISESARQEAINHLGVNREHAINISTAADDSFKPLHIPEEEKRSLLTRHGLVRPFIMYSGATDERKNHLGLIRAFSILPYELRRSHQLAIVGGMPEDRREKFTEYSKVCGLEPNELIITGRVTDKEMAQLYNLCKLFVFPSQHEGFGLPALEAMSCGAAVIGSNNTSLPEVIGREDALFDPFDEKNISNKIIEVLADDFFRNDLARHGITQSKKFSWDKSAKNAISALEGYYQKNNELRKASYRHYPSSYSWLIDETSALSKTQAVNEVIRTSQAIQQNCLNAIERQLFLDVSELSQRDAGSGVQRVVRNHLKNLLERPPEGFRVEPVYATRDEGYRYARRFTRSFLGDSTSRPGADDPIYWQRGDIFFALDMQHDVQLSQKNFYDRLRAEGVTVKFMVYDLLPIQLEDIFNVTHTDAKQLHKDWIGLVAKTDGAICISNATANAFHEYICDGGLDTAPNFSLAHVHLGADLDHANPSLGIPAEAERILGSLRRRPTFLCVSTIEPRKKQEQILDAFELLWLAGKDVNLVLVGRLGWKVESLADRLRTHPEAGQRFFWLEGISDEFLAQVYAAADCTIAASLNEGFGLSLIESAIKGVPLLVRDIPVFREVAGDHATYFSGLAPADLATALTSWLDLRLTGKLPDAKMITLLQWSESTRRLSQALIGSNYPRRQILVDVSELVQTDAGSGIQRVVRSILKESLAHPPEGFRVEPVYATTTEGYRYARQFSKRLLPSMQEAIPDEPIEFCPGDVFLGLDLQPQVVAAQRPFYHKLRANGVNVRFVIYDLLPVLMPQYFILGSDEGFTKWLDVVFESDGVICISKAVAEEVREWNDAKANTRARRFDIDWFHLGADTIHHALRIGNQENVEDFEKKLKLLKEKATFLIVSTIEPRKGHTQVLEAFEILWSEGIDTNLAIVGKQGWLVDDLCETIRRHPELNKRLFWFEGISDDYLAKAYDTSTCLIAASYGEGFGLPLIEAAQHGIPIIARDIPVFREVAGTNAFYFKAESAEKLSNSLKQWLALHAAGSHPTSNNLRFLNWSESAQNLLGTILDKEFNNHSTGDVKEL